MANPLKAILNAIFGVFGQIFKPIIKPLQAIANAFLMLVNGVVYIIMLFMWFIKLNIWFFVEVLPSIPRDIGALIGQITYIIFDGIFGTIRAVATKTVNLGGAMTVNAIASGWDNVPDESASTPKKTSKFGNTPEDATGEDCLKGRKCYKTPDGSIPFTVILCTVLFPPAGVFMEYGLSGWLNILICLLLTFMFYFPGLIYALILLYC